MASPVLGTVPAVSTGEKESGNKGNLDVTSKSRKATVANLHLAFTVHYALSSTLCILTQHVTTLLGRHNFILDMRKPRSRGVSNLPKVTQLVGGGATILT